MSHRQQILDQIAGLDPVEREDLVVELSNMVFPVRTGPSWLESRTASDSTFIVSTPNVCGGDARLIRTRIPVWTLERMRQLGCSEVDILRSFPALTALDLVQAWTYAARHKEEVEQAIRDNEEE